MGIPPAIVFVGLLVFLAHLFTALFERTKVPDVFFLIVIGLVLGPLSGIISPDDFGKVGTIMTTVALVVILFESGIGLDYEILKDSMRDATVMTAVNFLATVVVVGIITWAVTPLSFLTSVMLGTILGGTSSAVVIPMMRFLNMSGKSKTVLLLESAVSDVLCIVVALALMESFKYDELRIGLMAGRIVASFVLATLLGFISATVWSVLMNRVRELQNSMFTTPAFVLILYGLTEMLGYSGAIAALSFGFTLGHVHLFNVSLLKRVTQMAPAGLNETEKSFFAEIVFLLKTFFFVYVGISIPFSDPGLVLLGGMLTLAVFVLRIPVVRLAIPSSFPIGDLSIMSVMVPKGLAAAVLAGIPSQLGIPGGDLIRNVVYATVLFSISACALMVFLLEREPVARAYAGFFPKRGQAAP